MKKYVKLYEEYIEPDPYEAYYDEEGFINDKKMADRWLIEFTTTKMYGHQRYVIHKDGKLYVSSTGDIIFEESEFERLRVRFDEVAGFFNLSDNKNLNTLIGFPVKAGDVSLYGCESLQSLKYCTKFIKEGLNIKNTSLITLQHLPDSTGVKWVYIYDDIPTLVSDKFEPTKTVKGMGPIAIYPPQGTIEERAKRYFDYLLSHPDSGWNLKWLQTYDKEFTTHPDFIKVGLEMGFDLDISDDVKDIASAALKGNHKLR